LVTVFERADRIGGLLRYGIPEFKLEKRWLDRRLDLMKQEGILFRTSCHVGVDVSADDLRANFDAIVLAGGATEARDLKVPGRELDGIYFAMEYLPLQNRRCEGDDIADAQFITAEGKNVVIIGGGDTGADCLGTAHRQGAKSVTQLELLSRPPDVRAASNPWPTWPNIFRVSSAHEEGGDRLFSISTAKFSGDDRGRVRALHTVEVETATVDGRFSFVPVAGTEREIPADLVLLAMGFLGPEKWGMLAQFDVRVTDRGNVSRDANWMTSAPGVFTAGDMQRGQSLIVWAIAEGRSCARGVDAYLMGESTLPAPVV
jgi:glutamate synthase (NADPH/NADH) small chain